MSAVRKTKLKLPAPRPRNPMVAPALQRKAGSHRKAEAAIRRADKMTLKQQISSRDD